MSLPAVSAARTTTGVANLWPSMVCDSTNTRSFDRTPDGDQPAQADGDARRGQALDAARRCPVVRERERIAQCDGGEISQLGLSASIEIDAEDLTDAQQIGNAGEEAVRHQVEPQPQPAGNARRR